MPYALPFIRHAYSYTCMYACMKASLYVHTCIVTCTQKEIHMPTVYTRNGHHPEMTNHDRQRDRQTNRLKV